MFDARIGYVSYGVLPWILIHSVVADIGDNGRPAPSLPLVRYNKGSPYSYTFL
jgi:hypothetical protein